MPTNRPLKAIFVPSSDVYYHALEMHALKESAQRGWGEFPSTHAVYPDYHPPSLKHLRSPRRCFNHRICGHPTTRFLMSIFREVGAWNSCRFYGHSSVDNSPPIDMGYLRSATGCGSAHQLLRLPIANFNFCVWASSHLTEMAKVSHCCHLCSQNPLTA
jgi:hypothetical protein